MRILGRIEFSEGTRGFNRGLGHRTEACRALISNLTGFSNHPKTVSRYQSWCSSPSDTLQLDSNGMPGCRARLLAAAVLMMAAGTGIGLLSSTYADDGGKSDRRTVKVVADQKLTVATAAGSGSLSLY